MLAEDWHELEKLKASLRTELEEAAACERELRHLDAYEAKVARRAVEAKMRELQSMIGVLALLRDRLRALKTQEPAC